MGKRLAAIAGLLLMVSCSGFQIPLLAGTPIASPSPLPEIISPTPVSVPSSTPAGSGSVTPSPTGSPSAPTLTPEVTLSPSPALLEVEILGCNTSLDITHGMGEVTNAFPVIRNKTGLDLVDVCATLSASDEARAHPDKTACTPALPAGYQVTLKLTVDTGFKQDTSISVDVTSPSGYEASTSRSSCRSLGVPGWIPGKVGLVEPIQ